MKRIGTLFLSPYLSLWHGLLAGACIILAYLTGVHICEALNTSSLFTFFRSEHACLSWAPSQGPVDHYLLEITDTCLTGGSVINNRLTTTRYATSPLPRYRLACSHNHSYKVRVKAVSPTGIPSAYSEPSILFICDQQSPQLLLTPLPSPQKVRSQSVTLTGSFDEPHMSSVAVNNIPATIDYKSHTFSATLTLAHGENPLEFRARDLAGNATTERSSITYAPLTIISLPGNARLYWNGNYAYPGSYGGRTPRAYKQAGLQKQTLRISLPGFQEYYGIIDFSDLSRDTYLISLLPHAPSVFTHLSLLFPPEGTPLPFAHAHPFVVDYNLDGNKDLLVGTADGTVALFLNQGNNAAPVLKDHLLLSCEDGLLDVGTNAAPLMLDYDNNGTFDLLVGNGEGLLHYYANRGSNTAPTFSSPRMLTTLDGSPIEVESDCTPWVVDWNGDDRKDLLLGNGSGRLLLSLNEGSEHHSLFSSLRPLMAGGKEIRADGLSSAPCIVDWNADGQMDLLLGTGDGYVYVYHTADGQKEPIITGTETIQLNGQALMLEGPLFPFPVDWNQDGKTELLIGTHEGEIYLAL